MFLNKLVERRESENEENNANLTDEEKLFLKAFGVDYTSYSGAALKEITYFTCIKILSEAIGKTPLYLERETEDGIERMTDDNLFELLSLRPNPYMSAIDCWKAVEALRQHDGISGLYKMYKKGMLVALYPIRITGITIDDAGLIRSKQKHKVLVDFTVAGTGLEHSALYEELLIFKGFSLDGINTHSIRDLARSTIDTNLKSQNYLNSLYDAGLTNKIVVQLTSDLKQEKEIKKVQEKFSRIYSKSKRIFTVPAGFNVSALNLSLSDAQFEQIRRMTISQIAAMFGIKMHQLNDLKDANNNSLEQQQVSFLVDTLLILYESIEQEVTYGLITKEKRRQGYQCKFNTNVILRSSPETQMKIITGYVASGVYTPNEGRRMLRRNKKEGGDDLIVNAGVLKMKDLGKNVKKEGE